jgi:decaprenylphospho-beta-D-ribofuranose 2-oxidase
MISKTIRHPFNFHFEWMKVSSFSSTFESQSYLAQPKSELHCHELVDYAKAEGYTICPKGGGYSYFDNVLNDREIVCDISMMNKIVSWNPETGVMVVEPGCRLNEVLLIGLLDNWTLKACPGGMSITMAGSLSGNVHGKDSWKSGNFGDQVIQFKIIDSMGVTHSVARHDELFNAVIGGVGLLGLVVEITLQLTKVESPFVEVTVEPSKNISQTIRLLEDSRKDKNFSVAWVDAFSKGRSVGRGFVTSAKWVDHPLPKNNSSDLRKALFKSTKIFDIFPSKETWQMLKPMFGPEMIRLANFLNYNQRLVRGKQTHITLFPLYNFMHNKIPDLESVYKPQGFYEFEPLIPNEGSEANLIKLLDLGRKYSGQSLLCAVKMHSADDYGLSYSLDGYSIGIDIQRKNRNIEDIRRYANEIYELTIETGGKIYLCKDELVSKVQFQKMYENFQSFMAIKNKFDEIGLFQSNMYRRLFL